MAGNRGGRRDDDGVDPAKPRKSKKSKNNNGGASAGNEGDTDPGSLQLANRPRRLATTEEARLKHMLGDDAGEIAKWLAKNPAALAKAKAARAKVTVESTVNVNGKRERPQMKSLFPDGESSEDKDEDEDGDGDSSDDDDGSGAARREHSPELSESEYKEGDDGEEEESDGEKSDDLEEEDVAKELESDPEVPVPVDDDGGNNEDAGKEDLPDLLATIPGKESRKKKQKAKTSRAIIAAPEKKKTLKGNGRRTMAGNLVLTAAGDSEAGFDRDFKLLLMSHLKMQQTQAEDRERNIRLEKALLQLLNNSKRRGSGSSLQSSDPATSSVTVTQQAARSEGQLGLLEELKANPKLLSSSGSRIKLLASDAVNLTMLTSGVADSELMRSNTKLAFRVGPDPEQEELFNELYEDFIQPHQMDKFRQKRGQAVSAIRAAGTTCYNLPASGTEDWSRVTTELLAGDAYRKLGPDAYGDPRFRRVLAKACGVDTDNQPVPDKLIVTVARLAMVEVVLELHFRGIKRLEKQETSMLQGREQALADEARVSTSVLIVAPEDSSVCPERIKGRAQERARAIEESRGSIPTARMDGPQIEETGPNPE